MAYDINDNVNVYAGVNNLFDQKPDVRLQLLPDLRDGPLLLRGRAG